MGLPVLRLRSLNSSWMVVTSEVELSGLHLGAWPSRVFRFTSEKGIPDWVSKLPISLGINNEEKKIYDPAEPLKEHLNKRDRVSQDFWPLFFHVSNPSGPVIHMQKYFRIPYGFDIAEIFANAKNCRVKLHSIIDNPE